MTRIISGMAGGRRLETPPGEATRPTSDRVREALFSMLEARNAIRGRRVLDLFAGSGALGLEAASRGAAEVVLVESSRQAIGVARRNAAVVGIVRVTAVLSSVQRYLERRPDRPFDLVLLDPPYGLAEPVLGGHLAALNDGGWLTPDALVVVERSTRSPEPRWPAGLARAEPSRPVARQARPAGWGGADPQAPASGSVSRRGSARAAGQQVPCTRER
jgi:16S rRNA (guanine966-N2)-methyltransferase